MTAPAASRRRKLWTPDDDAEASAWFDAMLVETLHTEITHILPSEWATAHRILPEGLTSMPGPFRWDVTPYWREVLDCLAPTSPIREVYVAKGAQVGYTVAVLENFIGYVIGIEPGPAMFISADAGVAEASVELRVDRMIESAGLAEKIFPQVAKKANKKTGDTKAKKEFPGGFLLAVGPNSGGKLRSFAIRYLLGDELDAMPLEVGGSARDAVTAQEGDPWGLAVRRTDSFEAIRKILGGSTPLIKQTSRIAALYDEGDARRYYVPCRQCGAMQVLEWKRIHYDKDEAGRLKWDSVYYECAECGARWRNADKAYFLTRGEWRPTQEPRRPHVRSYHLSSLYSPVGMRSWEDIVEEWVKAQGNPARLRVFVNTVLGEPYEERGDAPPAERVMLRREDYAAELLRIEYAKDADGQPTKTIAAYEWTPGALPSGPLILTLGADVMHDRIEVELVAWGRDKETWSAGYHVLPGDTSDPNGQPWAMLRELIEREHAGLPISLSLVDSGEGDMMATVYDYCDTFLARVLPSKGADNTVGRGRVFALRDVAGHLVQRADLDTSQLKGEFYAATRVGPIEAPPAGEPFARYCHYPLEYDKRYFDMLYSERVVTKRTQTGVRQYWDNEGRANHALDCRVLNYGALYILASAATAADDDTSGEVDWSEFWALLSDNAGR